MIIKYDDHEDGNAKDRNKLHVDVNATKLLPSINTSEEIENPDLNCLPKFLINDFDNLIIEDETKCFISDSNCNKILSGNNSYGDLDTSESDNKNLNPEKNCNMNNNMNMNSSSSDRFIPTNYYNFNNNYIYGHYSSNYSRCNFNKYNSKINNSDFQHNEENVSVKSVNPETLSENKQIKSYAQDINNPLYTTNSKIFFSKYELYTSNQIVMDTSQINLNTSTFKNEGFKLKVSKNNHEEFENFEELIDRFQSNQKDIINYLCTQKGSRVLQKILSKISPNKLDNLLEILKNELYCLMTDIYGNYLCQKIIQSCSPKQRIFIIKNISESFTDIACNTSGTHSLQTLIESINLQEEEEIIKESIKHNILRLSLDPNGTHVIQKIISCVNEASRKEINNKIIENFYKLVYDSNGICVLKKIVKGNEDLELRKLIVNKIKVNALEIIQNPYGNYIVQHILNEWGIVTCKDVLNIIILNIISLSMQKFSSNVVEKCFELVDESSRKLIIKEIFNHTKIPSLIKNKYGNFVLQKAIIVLTNDEKKLIKNELTSKVILNNTKEKARLSTLLSFL